MRHQHAARWDVAGTRSRAFTCVRRLGARFGLPVPAWARAHVVRTVTGRMRPDGSSEGMWGMSGTTALRMVRRRRRSDPRHQRAGFKLAAFPHMRPARGDLELVVYENGQELARRREFVACWFDDAAHLPFLVQSECVFHKRVLEASVVLSSVLQHLLEGGLSPEQSMAQGALLLVCAAADAGLFHDPEDGWSALANLLVGPMACNWPPPCNRRR